MAKLNLSVKHTFLRKLKRYRKQLLIAAPIVVSIVFAFYAQTYFQQQQDLKSRAGEHETSITVSNKYLDIIIKNDGTLQSFYDKRNGRELI
ncbi:hypothetical protein KKG52_00115, partial [Patescibacteria group bacterium]|nr:hypothetical protein [Patescibacteria group bacterium]